VSSSREPRDPRERRRLALRFRPAGSTDQSRPGFTEDFSLTGVFIQTIAPYGAGSLLEIEFDSEDGPITVKGKVMWAKRAPMSLAQNKRSGMGVELLSVPEELKALAGLT
jgi:Tfp pilus assembly protein PilZ